PDLDRQRGAGDPQGALAGRPPAARFLRLEVPDFALDVSVISVTIAPPFYPVRTTRTNRSGGIRIPQLFLVSPVKVDKTNSSRQSDTRKSRQVRLCGFTECSDFIRYVKGWNCI